MADELTQTDAGGSSGFEDPFGDTYSGESYDIDLGAGFDQYGNANEPVGGDFQWYDFGSNLNDPFSDWALGGTGNYDWVQRELDSGSPTGTGDKYWDQLWNAAQLSGGGEYDASGALMSGIWGPGFGGWDRINGSSLPEWAQDQIYANRQAMGPTASTADAAAAAGNMPFAQSLVAAGSDPLDFSLDDQMRRYVQTPENQLYATGPSYSGVYSPEQAALEQQYGINSGNAASALGDLLQGNSQGNSAMDTAGQSPFTQNFGALQQTFAQPEDTQQGFMQGAQQAPEAQQSFLSRLLNGVLGAVGKVGLSGNIGGLGLQLGAGAGSAASAIKGLKDRENQAQQRMQMGVQATSPQNINAMSRQMFPGLQGGQGQFSNIAQLLSNPGALSPGAYERAQEQANLGQQAMLQQLSNSMGRGGWGANSGMNRVLQQGAMAAAMNQRNEANRAFTQMSEQLKRGDLQQAMQSYLAAMGNLSGLAGQQNQSIQNWPLLAGQGYSYGATALAQLLQQLLQANQAQNPDQNQ